MTNDCPGGTITIHEPLVRIYGLLRTGRGIRRIRVRCPLCGTYVMTSVKCGGNIVHTLLKHKRL